MKKSAIAAIVMFGFLFGSSSALADDQVKTISFEDDRIEGELMMPNSSNIGAHEIEELSSLIKAREDFVEEMRKTVDEL